MALTELKAVAAVAARGNFRAAAVDLGLSRSALSHAIATLEGRTGIRLFNRTTRSVSLTPAGEQFLARIQPALHQISAALDGLNDQRMTPGGTLRINTSEIAARQIFAPIVLEYMRRFPDMRVDLVTEGRFVDIVADGFDAGIRLMESVPQDMIAVACGPEQRLVVACAPDYLTGRPVPRTPADLLSHSCIRMRLPGGLYRWEFEKHGEQIRLDVTGHLTLTDADLMREAALAGLGFAYLSTWQIADDLKVGRLVTVLEDWTPPFPGLALYYPGHRHVTAGLRAFIDVVREVTSGRRTV